MFVVAGAVNSGFSGFVFAIPAAIGLIVALWRPLGLRFLATIMVLLACWISYTQNQNPWLYPDIGKVFFLKTDLVRYSCWDPVSRSSQIMVLPQYYANSMGSNCKEQNRLSAGTQVKVISAYREHGEFSTEVGLNIKPLEKVSSPKNASWYLLDFRNPQTLSPYPVLQAHWAQSLSTLMDWPAIFILLPMMAHRIL